MCYYTFVHASLSILELQWKTIKSNQLIRFRLSPVSAGNISVVNTRCTAYTYLWKNRKQFLLLLSTPGHFINIWLWKSLRILWWHDKDIYLQTSMLHTVTGWEKPPLVCLSLIIEASRGFNIRIQTAINQRDILSSTFWSNSLWKCQASCVWRSYSHLHWHRASEIKMITLRYYGAE